MSKEETIVLFDHVKEKKCVGEYSGSIISKCQDEFDSIIFSDNINILEDSIHISEGLMVGFELIEDKKIAFSRRLPLNWDLKKDNTLEYCIKIPRDIMDQYDEGQFSDAFPFTLNLLHTTGLLFKDSNYRINHIDFFYGEILKNPVASIQNGVLISDRVVIDHRGDPVFYDCLIVGRGDNDQLSVSYEPIANVDDKVIEYIIILGIEELKL